MNKTELTKQEAERLSIPHYEAIRYMNAVQAVLTSELQQEGSIILQGFGTFLPWEQSERLGRNPKTGTPCMIRERVSVKFKPGKYLLDAINANGED
ncbi:HU family DNA-binding protein [Bacteroides sp. AM07-16]|uniref:HU family DNA-binding protein n=1 Tax=Parabacteroides bouchesdurhonensis TaxID=1936995 RepID=UPI000E4B861F|nr:HU family DNA-binding protein [Parabacteroides bouchesdurhonensis]RHJ91661.1 HU family DNA-binding protein [Bacteroides sp. AM07-16]